MLMNKVSIIVGFVFSTIAGAALAADKDYSVHFAKGTNSVNYSHSVTHSDINTYTFSAKSEQHLKVKLNAKGATYFNILTSDDNVAFNGSSDGDNADLPLPYDGTFKIQVYSMGANKSKKVNYKLAISIK